MSFLAGRLRLLPGMVRKVSKSQVITRRNMPSCAVDANFPIPKGFEVKLSRKLADMLNKPERLVSVSVNSGLQMCRAGNNNPTMTVNIWSIGVFDAERNPEYSKELYEFFNQHVNLPVDRIALFFHPIEKASAGHLLYAELQEGKK